MKKAFFIPAGAAVLLSLGVMAGPTAFAQNTTVIPGSMAPGLSQFTDLGEASPSDTMPITVYLNLQNQGQLQRDLNAHVKMSTADFHSQFSPTSANYHAVINQLQNAGLTINGTSDNNMVVDATGTVAQIESVFGTTVHKFQDQKGNTFLANTTDFHVTGALASQLAGVSGTDQYAQPRPMLQNTSSAAGEGMTSTTKSKTTSSFFDGNNAANVQKAYNFGPVYQSGTDGNGETIAIVDAYGSPTIQNDLQVYHDQVEQGAFGYDRPLNLEVVSPPGMSQLATKNPVKGSDAAGWAGEVSMDVELSHAVAPGAKILLVATPNNYNDLYMGVNYVIDNHLADQLSLSFGGPESYTPANERHAIDQMFAEAALTGINVFVSSGDWGDFTGDPFYAPTPTVSFPASDPNVIAVGGSSLFVNKDNSYSSEIEWGETLTKKVTPDGTVTYPNQFWGGTGGGTSSVFAKPSWQTSVSGLSNTNMRQVPDVGYNSDPYTGFALVQNGEVQDGWGGTSDAAPQWAAICALANQAHNKNFGTSLPYINPLLYANGQNGLHDVQHAAAGFDYFGSVTGNHYYVTMGSDTSLAATPGWDDTTGLGTPDVAQVVNMLSQSN